MSRHDRPAVDTDVCHPEEAMSTTIREKRQQDLRDAIVRKLYQIGCACAPDLANEIRVAKDADDVLEALKGLEADGVIKKVTDKSDPRDYSHPMRRVYELAR